MTRAKDQPFDALTVASLVREERPLDILCSCGHHARLSVEDLKRQPRHVRLWSLRRRLSCVQCGRVGDVYIQPAATPAKAVH